MATRSYIAIEREDNGFDFIYCHYDGYPEHQYSTLHNYYYERDKLRALIDLGNISYLDKEISKIEAYGEEFCSVGDLAQLLTIFKNNSSIEFLYFLPKNYPVFIAVDRQHGILRIKKEWLEKERD